MSDDSPESYETIDLSTTALDPAVSRAIPTLIIRQYHMLPVMKASGVLIVAAAEVDTEMFDALRHMLRPHPILFCLADRQQIDELIERHYPGPFTVETFGSCVDD